MAMYGSMNIVGSIYIILIYCIMGMDMSDNNIIPLPKMEVEQSSLPYAAHMLPVWATWSFMWYWLAI